MRVTVFDYGAGNLHSLEKALTAPDWDVRIADDPARAIDTDVLVLPGVGAFGSAAARLSPAREEMRAAVLGGLPCIGICLGMQLLFANSDEGPGEGLGILGGGVERLRAGRVPQIGWNALDEPSDDVFEVAPLTVAYYANGFVCRPTDPSAVRAWSTHERDRFPAMVRAGSAVGVQFHPEKSSTPGVRFLHALIAEHAR